MSKQRPILFSTPMVQAILQGRKTQTRRIIKPQPDNPNAKGISPIWGQGVPVGLKGNPMASEMNPTKKDPWNYFGIHCATNVDGLRVDKYICCPYGKPGDIIWVRETWAKHPTEGFLFKASDPENDFIGENLKWRPSIHMPREACRLFLKITNIRVERLQDISEQDARAEGVPEYYLPASHTSDGSYYSYGFNCLWNEINGKESWEANPWVWAITFERTEKQ